MAITKPDLALKRAFLCTPYGFSSGIPSDTFFVRPSAKKP